MQAKQFRNDTVLEFGAGLGAYTAYLRASGRGVVRFIPICLLPRVVGYRLYHIKSHGAAALQGICPLCPICMMLMSCYMLLQEAAGTDGVPNVKALSQGLVTMADLTAPDLNLGRRSWVLCLEVMLCSSSVANATCGYDCTPEHRRT